MVWKTLWAMLTICASIAVVFVAFFAMGYTFEKVAIQVRSDRCINSACDTPCANVKKFVRHQGECK